MKIPVQIENCSNHDISVPEIVYEYPGVYFVAAEDSGRSEIAWLGRLGIICDPAWSIREVSGYLPHQSWVFPEDFHPPHSDESAIVFWESTANEDSLLFDCNFITMASRSEKSLYIQVCGADDPTIFFSIYPNFLIGVYYQGVNAFLSSLYLSGIVERKFSLKQPGPW